MRAFLSPPLSNWTFALKQDINKKTCATHKEKPQLSKRTCVLTVLGPKCRFHFSCIHASGSFSFMRKRHLFVLCFKSQPTFSCEYMPMRLLFLLFLSLSTPHGLLHTVAIWVWNLFPSFVNFSFVRWEGRKEGGMAWDGKENNAAQCNFIIFKLANVFFLFIDDGPRGTKRGREGGNSTTNQCINLFFSWPTMLSPTSLLIFHLNSLTLPFSISLDKYAPWTKLHYQRQRFAIFWLSDALSLWSNKTHWPFLFVMIGSAGGQDGICVVKT